MYIFSPSINVDQTWEAVNKYGEYVMKVIETDEEQYLFSENNPDIIIALHSKVILQQKKQKQSHVYSMLLIIDDHADDPAFSLQSRQ